MTTPKHSEPKGERNQDAFKASLTGVRLRKHADYQAAYARARKHQSSSMSWFLAPRQITSPVISPITSPTRGADAEACTDQTCADQACVELTGPRVGLTAGKVLGKAHERNRIKRRMREVLRRHLGLLPKNADLILHPRRTVLTMDFAKLEAEVVRILNQARAELLRTENQLAAEAAKRRT